MTDKREIPKIFKDYIKNISEDIVEEGLDYNNIKFNITQKQAIEDLRFFQYILNNGYSGREYWENKGFDFENAYNSIKDYINNHELINKSDMFNLYHQALEGIHDGHLSLMTYGKRVNMGKKYKVYFSDILLEKKKHEYEVLYSGFPKVKKGDLFSSNQLKNKLFRTLSPKGCEHYLLGCRSWNVISKINIDNKDSKISIPLHPCRASDFKKVYKSIFQKDIIDKYNIVTSSRFWNWDEDVANDFYKCGLSLRDEDIVIWDLRGNGGGDSRYPKQFIKGLNDYSYWKVDCAVLDSPIINQSEESLGKRQWKFWLSNERDMSKGVFDGTLYVLSNDDIASSGEAALEIIKSVKSCIVVGQNSSGIGVFGDVNTYQLPFSDIRLIVPINYS